MISDKIPHIDLNQVLALIMLQVRDSMPFVVADVPRFRSPDQLWAFWKRLVRFEYDPETVEYIRSVPTLVADGVGDCDCFTVAVTSCLVADGLTRNSRIVLAGNRKRYPSHIYNCVYMGGERIPLDLTNPVYGMERPYKYYQELEFH